MLCSPSAIPCYWILLRLIRGRLRQQANRERRIAWWEGIESVFGTGAELHPGPQLLWEGMAEASSWLAVLLRTKERDGENDGSEDRHHWLAPGVSQGLLQPSEGGEKHLWSWVLRMSWQLVL